MKKFTVITLSAMFCGLVVLSACGGGAASGSAASSDAPLGRVPAIFAEVAAKKKALDESLRKEDDLDRYQKKLKEFDEYAAKSYQKAAEEGEKLVGREIVCTGDSVVTEVVVSAVLSETVEPCLGLKNRRRRALDTTNTELKLIANAATIGFIFRLKAVYQHPAAMGMPMML